MKDVVVYSFWEIFLHNGLTTLPWPPIPSCVYSTYYIYPTVSYALLLNGKLFEGRNQFLFFMITPALTTAPCT